MGNQVKLRGLEVDVGKAARVSHGTTNSDHLCLMNGILVPLLPTTWLFSRLEPD